MKGCWRPFATVRKLQVRVVQEVLELDSSLVSRTAAADHSD
jgi:hypothetical protein